MKFRFASVFALMIASLTLFSCNGNKKDSFTGEIIKGSDKLEVTTDSTFKKEYDVSNNGGATFDITGLEVKFDNSLLKYCENETTITPGTYFITLSDTTPKSSWLKKNSKMQTGKNKYSLNVYVATITTDEKQLYVSNAISIILINKNVVNPVLYYVGGAVIIVAVAALAYFAKRSKDKQTK